MLTGVISDSTKGSEYFRHIRLEFSNDVKIHVFVMFLDRWFVDINEGIYARCMHAGVSSTCRKHCITSFLDLISSFPLIK